MPDEEDPTLCQCVLKGVTPIPNGWVSVDIKCMQPAIGKVTLTCPNNHNRTKRFCQPHDPSKFEGLCEPCKNELGEAHNVIATETEYF